MGSLLLCILIILLIIVIYESIYGNFLIDFSFSRTSPSDYLKKDIVFSCPNDDSQKEFINVGLESFKITSTDTQFVRVYKNHILRVNTPNSLFLTPVINFYSGNQIMLPSESPYTAKVSMIVGSSLSKYESQINISIFGVSPAPPNMEFISEINLPEKLNIPGIFLRNSGQEFVKVSVIPLQNEDTKETFTILNVKGNTPLSNVNLPPGTEFYIFASYILEDSNIPTTLSENRSDYYCR